MRHRAGSFGCRATEYSASAAGRKHPAANRLPSLRLVDYNTFVDAGLITRRGTSHYRLCGARAWPSRRGAPWDNSPDERVLVEHERQRLCVTWIDANSSAVSRSISWHSRSAPSRSRRATRPMQRTSRPSRGYRRSLPTPRVTRRVCVIRNRRAIDHRLLVDHIRPRREAHVSLVGLLYRCTGPLFDATPFDPSSIVATLVGSATLAFQVGNDARFSYTIGDVSRRKTITREIFEFPGTTCI